VHITLPSSIVRISADADAYRIMLSLRTALETVGLFVSDFLYFYSQTHAAIRHGSAHMKFVLTLYEFAVVGAGFLWSMVSQHVYLSIFSQRH